MRTLVLHRWALIFLLVSRLILGELGHAMPMTSMSGMAHEVAMVESDAVACPEHEPKQASGTSAESAHHTQSADAGATQDCCKSGDCECPCLHVPCAAVEPAAINAVYLQRQPVAAGISGLMQQRLSGLFRPPA